MIRRLRITDKKEYLALLSQLTTVGSISDTKWFLTFQKIEANPSLEIYVAVAICTSNSETSDSEEDNSETLLAAGTLLIEQKFIHEAALVGHIEDIVVAEKARGLGLGKQMVDFLVERAREVGAYKVILDTKEETEGFYSKLGFRKAEIQMRKDL